MPRSPSRCVLSVFGLLLLAGPAATGCKTLATSSPVSEGPLATPVAQATYHIEVRRNAGAPQRFQVPLPQDARVQHAVEQVGAARRFRDMEIWVNRDEGTTPEGLPRVARMTSRFDHASRAISYDTDVALRAGDEVVITEAPYTEIEKVLAPFTKPLAAMVRREK